MKNLLRPILIPAILAPQVSITRESYERRILSLFDNGIENLPANNEGKILDNQKGFTSINLYFSPIDLAKAKD